MPNFEQAVKVILATFTAFTGFTLSAAIASAAGKDDVTIWLMLIAVIALLLRYVIGSAIHLNYIYVEKTADGGPRSRAVFLLFKDFVFLVVFGMLAINIAVTLGKEGIDLAAFLWRSCYYLIAGFIWSPVDYVARYLYDKRYNSNELGVIGDFWKAWFWLDLIELGLTAVLLWVRTQAGAGHDFWIALFLAMLYVIFLYIDLRTMVAAARAATPVPASPRG